jgi:hypothetical protein
MKNFKSIVCLLAIFSILLPSSVEGQDSLPTPPTENKWHYRVEPYLMFPNMNGQTGLTRFPLIDVDASPSDIFSRLQMGFMLNLEASNGTWAVNSDFLYMDLEQDLLPTVAISSGTINVKQVGWELSVFRRVCPWLEVGGGALMNLLEFDMNLATDQPGGGTETRGAKQSKT